MTYKNYMYMLKEMKKISIVSISVIFILISCDPPYSQRIRNTYKFPVKVEIKQGFGYDCYINQTVYDIISDSLRNNKAYQHSKENNKDDEIETQIHDSIFNSTFINIAKRTSRFDTLFTTGFDFWKTNYIINPNEIKTVTLTQNKNISPQQLRIENIKVFDNEGNVIESIYCSPGLIIHSEFLSLPFSQNSFREDKAYQSYMKFVDDDKQCLKYIEIQELYNKKNYMKALSEINAYEFDKIPLTHSDLAKHESLIQEIYHEQNIGLYTLGLLCSYKLNEIDQVRFYWNKMLQNYSFRAYSLLVFDNEINGLLRKLNIVDYNLDTKETDEIYER